MSIVSSIKLILTLTCDDASHLVSDSVDRQLTRVERAALRAHLMICRNCRRFRRQLELLNAAVERWVSDDAPHVAIGSAALSEAARGRIRRSLSREFEP